jgi:ribonuclease P protein component
LGKAIVSGAVLISIPKKIVPLAVRRNRIKRLIREVTRKNSAFSGPKLYSFRVHSEPGGQVGLQDVRQAIEQCLSRQANA